MKLLHQILIIKNSLNKFIFTGFYYASLQHSKANLFFESVGSLYESDVRQST